MNIIEVSEYLFANKNREVKAKRKSLPDYFIRVKEIGYMSQYITSDEKPSKDPKDYFIQLIKGNRIIGSFNPELEDILANDWVITE